MKTPVKTPERRSRLTKSVSLIEDDATTTKTPAKRTTKKATEKSFADIKVLYLFSWAKFYDLSKILDPRRVGPRAGTIFTFDGAKMVMWGDCQYELVRALDNSFVVIVKRGSGSDGKYFDSVEVFWAASRSYKIYKGESWLMTRVFTFFFEIFLIMGNPLFRIFFL